MAIANILHATRGNSPQARRWLMGGRVQGVGYRAFVFNLAQRSGLSGIVQNLTGEVLVEAQGAPAALDAFAVALVSAAPPLARPQIVSCQLIQLRKPIFTFRRTTFCATIAAARCLIRTMRATATRSSTARNAGRAIR
jgi:acylphosphatase